MGKPVFNHVSLPFGQVVFVCESAFRHGGCSGVSRVSKDENALRKFERRRMFDRKYHSVSNLIPSISIDLVFQMFNFPQ